MHHFFAPFPLEPAVAQKLKAADLHPEGSSVADSKVSLLIYDSPHSLLSRTELHSGGFAGPAELLEAYQRLTRRAGTAPLISAWRLAGLSNYQLQQWLTNQAPCPVLGLAPPEIDPLLAAVTRSVLELIPGALELYLDLELQAELAGGAADTDYVVRLTQNACCEGLLTSWWQNQQELQANEQLRQSIVDLREEADLSLHQLQNTQVKLEELVINKKAAEEQLEDTANKLKWNQEKRKSLEEALKDTQDQLEKNLTKEKQERQEAEEESELLSLQLHQVQEELEMIFLEKQDVNTRLAETLKKLKWNQGKRKELSDKLDASQVTLDTLKQEYEAKLDASQITLDTLKQEHEAKLEAIDYESLLTLKQLHQAKKELERHYQLCQEQQMLLDQQNEVASKALLLAATSA